MNHKVSDGSGELTKIHASEYIKEQDGMTSVFHVSQGNPSLAIFRFCLQVFAFPESEPSFQRAAIRHHASCSKQYFYALFHGDN